MDNETKKDAPIGHDPAEPAPLKPAPLASSATKGPEPAKPSASGLSGASNSLAHGPGKTDADDGGPKHHAGLPVAEPFQGFSAPLPKERAGVFSQLVTDDGDIAGLVAYSIYKQNKLDWLAAFETAKGRAPSDEELASYIIGEGTPRRIATYRHLAEATLAGNGPSAGGAGTAPRVGLRRTTPTLGDNPALIATYAVIALLFLIGFLVAAHYTMSSR